MTGGEDKSEEEMQLTKACCDAHIFLVNDCLVNS